MIMNSGRFGGGGGGSGRSSGGSNRDVVFTARVDTKDARKELAAFGKDVDSLQKRLGGMRMGAGGGGPRQGGSGGGPSVVLGDSTFDRQQRSFFDKALREESRAIKQAAAERSRDMKNLKKDTKDAMEGLIGLSRAFVLFGVSSEENMEKAVRALAKFEGAVAGYKGGMKLAEGLGGLLGRGAGRAGIAAGGGTMALGAAGIAAGVGVLGGGLAIYDQIRYMQGKPTSGYDRGYANAATGLAGTLSGYGIRPGGGGIGRFLGASNPFIGAASSVLQTGGFYDAADSNARYGSSLQSSIGRAGGAVEESQRRLAIEQQILGIMEREAETIRQASAAADQRRNGAAMSFAALSPWDQRGVSKLRDRFLSNPGALSNRELQALQPFVGSSENSQIQSRIRERLPAGFLTRGFAGESEADFRRAGESGSRPNGVNIQRNIVLNVERDLAGEKQVLEDMLNRAFEAQDEALRKWAEEFERRFQANLSRQEQQRQLGIGAQISGFGGGAGF